VQLPLLLKLPAALFTELAASSEKLTVPCGQDLVPESVSDTVAVQVEPWFRETGVAQTTLVEVDRLVTVSAKPMLSLLSTWIESLAV
jgi:hypothetical protein